MYAKKIILFILIFQTPLWAQQNTEQLFHSATKAYRSNNFTQAIELYNQVEKTGYVAPELYYNLGNCYYRTNALGKAMLYYERALKLAPNDEDIIHNIEVARTQLNDDIEPLPAFFLFKWIRSLRDTFSSNTWAIFVLLLLWLGITCLVFRLLNKQIRWNKQAVIGGIICLLLSTIAFIFCSNKRSIEQNYPYAIVMAEKTDFRSAPDPQSQKVLDIHEGLKVQLIDELSDWYKVRLMDGEQGWLRKESVERI